MPPQQPAPNGVINPALLGGGNAAHFPDFRPSPNQLPPLYPVPTPRTDPDAFNRNLHIRPRDPLPYGQTFQPPGAPRLGCMFAR